MPQSWDEHGNPITASSPTQSWDERGNAIVAPSGISNAMSHAGDRLSEIPGAIGNMVLHPIDTASSIYQQGKQLAGEGIDAVKAGDYPLAAARAIETVMPGVGPVIAGGFKTIKSGDTSGGIGDMIGTVGPALALKGASVSPKVRAFAGGAKSAVTENVPSFRVNHMTVQAPVPAPIAGAFTGAAFGKMIGHPISGATVGALTPIIRGGMRAAKGEPWLPQAAEAIPNSFTPSGQGLLGRGGIVMPPPDAVDASYVRGVPAMAHPPNPARAIEAPIAARQMPGDISGGGSFVRGVPAMTQPPNPARALSAAPRTLVTPAPIDASYVRGIDAQYPEIIKGPLTPSEAALPKPIQSAAPTSAPDYSSITEKYKPSRTKARFDASGKRIGG